jgi:hypothetical protein
MRTEANQIGANQDTTYQKPRESSPSRDLHYSNQGAVARAHTQELSHGDRDAYYAHMSGATNALEWHMSVSESHQQDAGQIPGQMEKSTPRSKSNLATPSVGTPRTAATTPATRIATPATTPATRIATPATTPATRIATPATPTRGTPRTPATPTATGTIRATQKPATPATPRIATVPTLNTPKSTPKTPHSSRSNVLAVTSPRTPRDVAPVITPRGTSPRDVSRINVAEASPKDRPRSASSAHKSAVSATAPCVSAQTQKSPRDRPLSATAATGRARTGATMTGYTVTGSRPGVLPNNNDNTIPTTTTTTTNSSSSSNNNNNYNNNKSRADKPEASSILSPRDKSVFNKSNGFLDSPRDCSVSKYRETSLGTPACPCSTAETSTSLSLSLSPRGNIGPLVAGRTEQATRDVSGRASGSPGLVNPGGTPGSPRLVNPGGTPGSPKLVNPGLYNINRDAAPGRAYTSPAPANAVMLSPRQSPIAQNSTGKTSADKPPVSPRPANPKLPISAASPRHVPARATSISTAEATAVALRDRGLVSPRSTGTKTAGDPVVAGFRERVAALPSDLPLRSPRDRSAMMSPRDTSSASLRLTVQVISCFDLRSRFLFLFFIFVFSFSPCLFFSSCFSFSFSSFFRLRILFSILFSIFLFFFLFSVLLLF